MRAPSDPSPVLERHVEPTRRRQLWWWALAGTAAANAALTVAVATRPSSGAFSIAMTIHQAPAAPSAPLAAPAAAPSPSPAGALAPAVTPALAPPPVATSGPAPFADLGPCPAPFTGKPAPRIGQPTTDPLVGVATSPTDSRRLAAWNDQHLYVSSDGGRSWDRVLDGVGHVLDATFDCHGRAVALRRGDGLGMRDGIHERWSEIDGVYLSLARLDAEEGEVIDDLEADDAQSPYLPRLVGGGRAVAVLGAGRGPEADHAHLASITPDGGRSWRRVQLSYWEGTIARGEWTGDTLRLAVPWTDCMAEGIHLVSVSPRGTRTVEIPEYSHELAVAGASLLSGASTCARGGDGDDTSLCLWRGDRWHPLAGPPLDADDEDDRILVDGPFDVLVHGDRVFRVGARGLARRGRPWTSGWLPRTTDRTGRLWGLDPYGKLVRD